MLLTLPEMGSSRDFGQVWTISGDHRIGCLRQLYLPLRQDPAIHRLAVSVISRSQAGRGLRCVLRHYQSTQPDTDLRHQHHLRQTHRPGKADVWNERPPTMRNQHRSSAIAVAPRSVRSLQCAIAAKPAAAQRLEARTCMAASGEVVQGEMCIAARRCCGWPCRVGR